MQFRRYLSVAVALCGFLPISAGADPTLECSSAASQVEIGACVAEMAERVDLAVDAAFGFALDAAQELDDITERDATVPALEAGQKAWIAYRDAHCDYVGATFGGGSGTGIGIDACRVRLGRERVDTLLRLAQ